MTRRCRYIVMLLSFVVAFGAVRPSGAFAPSADNPLDKLESAVPTSAESCSRAALVQIQALASKIEAAEAAQAQFDGLTGAGALIERLKAILAAKQRIDELLSRALALRGDFGDLKPGPDRRKRIRAYLGITSVLIDLSGRLRYLLYDATGMVTDAIEPQSAEFNQLVDLLIDAKSSIGAAIVAGDLFVPPKDSQPASRRAASISKLKLLKLVAVTRQYQLLPELADFASDPETPAHLVIAAAETILQVGLPQDPLPQRDAKLPAPPITAKQLYKLVAGVDSSRLEGEPLRQRTRLLGQLAIHMKEGLPADSLRLGIAEIRPGDWLLMRNPSPYNRFTDLAPGLFTHVGVMTTYTAPDGLRRMVLVDLPERGTKIVPTNVDAYVLRTLHYVVLRHHDPAVGAQMAKVARSVIGNPSQFDLNFRTDRVMRLRGQPLAGRKIHTYCAGLLLLCAQETTAPRSEFFPIPEFPAGGNTVHNLARLGLSFGEHFISPTGALFSPHLQIVARQSSMYDPGREVQEAIFDHFARRLIDRTLTPSPDLYQSVRLKLARMSKTNPLLARAIAGAAGVSADSDLVSSAKAAAVVETLDDAAQGNGAEFTQAFRALRAGPAETLEENGYTKEEIAALMAYRRRHAELFQSYIDHRTSPRDLRLELVRFYIARGQRELDQRFFHTSDAPGQD